MKNEGDGDRGPRRFQLKFSWEVERDRKTEPPRLSEDVFMAIIAAMMDRHVGRFDGHKQAIISLQTCLSEAFLEVAEGYREFPK